MAALAPHSAALRQASHKLRSQLNNNRRQNIDQRDADDVSFVRGQNYIMILVRIHCPIQLYGCVFSEGYRRDYCTR